MVAGISASCSYILRNASEVELARGEGEIITYGDRFSISSKLGEAITCSYVDVIEILSKDYRINMTLSSGEKLAVYDLGYKFDDVVSSLFHLRNETVLKYLLMNESIRRTDIWGDIDVDSAGTKKELGKCEIRFYETSLVFLPMINDPIQVQYNRIIEVKVQDYSLSINTETGEKFTFLRLGRVFDSASKALSDSINALNIQTQTIIKELAPSTGPSALIALSRIMKDGKATTVQQMKSISPTTWLELEKSLQRTSIWNEYQYLQSISRYEKIAVGLKRGLMGDVTGNHVWLLMPIYGNDHAYGNAIALEAAKLPSGNTEKGLNAEQPETNMEVAGNATYFFRVAERNEYPGLVINVEELNKRFDMATRQINDMMMSINFRREPIYLSEE